MDNVDYIFLSLFLLASALLQVLEWISAVQDRKWFYIILSPLAVICLCRWAYLIWSMHHGA